MWRAFGWLGVVALAICARWFDSDVCRVTSAFGVFALIGFSAPRSLRPALALIAASALALLVTTGAVALLDSLPMLIAGFVAWVFARTLRDGRRPLIARAIATLDGEEQLRDPAVMRYARRLTWIWAIWQSLLAALGGVLALRARGGLPWLPAWAPSPALFGAVWLPLAVIVLFLGEFALRPRLLSQVSRHTLPGFIRALVTAWPRLLGD